MARPGKLGLDYFPLDTDIEQDDKIALIEAKYGITGFGIVLKLLIKIYRNGYFYNWNSEARLLFSSRVNVEEEVIRAIVEDAVSWQIFDRQKYDKYKILTSAGIQKRYIAAVTKRKKIEMIKDYICVDDIEAGNLKFKSLGSKGSGRKKKKADKKDKLKYLDHVYLLEEEYHKLIERLTKTGADKMIERLNGYIWQIGVKKANAKYSSHYHTILNWVRMDKEKKESSGDVRPKFKAERKLDDDKYTEAERKFFS